MRFIFVFIIVLITAIAAFVVFSYMEKEFLGIILAGIMIAWPLLFWFISKIFENKGKKKEEAKRIKEDIIGEISETIETKPTENIKSGEKNETEKTDEEEFVVPQKRDVNINKAKEKLKKLKNVSEVLEDEKKEGILSEEIYIELKKQNEETIEKLELEITKASGEIREKKIYCPKGKHYVSVSVCFPSKVKGYVICPEHNEEIRVE